MSQRRASEGGVFTDYDLDPNYYDEMFGTDGSARQACKRLNAALAELAPEDLTRLQEGVYRHFLHEGITFTVLDAERATEQIIPIDCVPRVLTGAEWEHIERGLKQRLTALNLFLKDVYHDGRCLRDKVVPIDLVLGCPQYRMEMRGLKVPHDVYVAVCGTDIVRTNDGFAVLEDNLRVPSGVSYMLACRNAIKDAFPRLYRAHRVREVADYAERLYSTLASLRPSLQDPQVAILTPGIHNSAYYEHAFLAGEMGIHLVEGQDLVLRDGALHMRTTAGLRRVDVLYRRIDDDYLDPVMFRGESVLGAAGLFHAYRTGNLVLANAPGTGVADDKSLYSYVPAIIRYFLGEEPVLANVETHLCREPDGLAYTLEHLEELVVKEVGGAGGYGMLVGPHASAEERATYAERVRADPANFISQPVLALSRAPCFVGGAIEPRHVDLRPFVLQGRDEQHVVPGGLCRVALRRGSLVVNSSQGGGCKDLWILED
ncbi:MAG: circularly permuted type 2 ATP-grasp protein [Deltaproteobacteria bacterium]|nr:circularly permuted type 2 ATP-grasp protein [Deltaproteobacteria bacterium]